MKKVIGIILFIVFVAGILISIYVIIDDYSRLDEWETISDATLIAPSILAIILFSLGIFYIVATKFGSVNPTVLENLEKENEIIRKQIEKKELLAKLESLENK